jgi:hypothetical protein
MRKATLRSTSVFLGLFLAPCTFAADIAAYRAAVLGADGIVDHYAFEGDFADGVDGGNGLNNGRVTPAGTPLLEEGVDGEGQAARFDGANDSIAINRSIQDDFSILGWVLSSEIQINIGAQYWQGSGLVYADVPGGANDFGASINGTKLGLGIGNPDQTVLSSTDVTGPSACGWTHFAAIRRVLPGGGSSLELYINGELNAQMAAANAAALTASATITIGGNTIDSRYMNGVLDEISLFGAALDAADVHALYAAADFEVDVGGCLAPDARCDGLTLSGPPGDKTGVWTLTASGSDGGGEPVTYFFTATHEDGTRFVAGPQDIDNAAFTLAKAGRWTFAVRVDDRPCCPDGAGAACSEERTLDGYGLTDFQGRIVTEAFLIAGPFQQPYGCGPSPANLLRNYIAPSRISCLYPRAGEVLDYDPAQSVSTGYIGPEADGVPTWRPFDDGSPEDGDLNFLFDDVGPRNDVVSWAVSYVEYKGAAPVTVDVCLGSDDSGQVWFNDALVINSSACRGRGDCDATGSITLSAGVYRIAAAAWNGVGDWGLRVTLQIPGVGPILGDPALFPDWTFHGRSRPASFVPPECQGCEPEAVRNLTCEFGRVGFGRGLILNWENPPEVDNNVPTRIVINGVDIATAASTATTASILPALLPAGGFYTVDVIHCGGVPATCTPFKTDDLGALLTSSFQVLGPFTHTAGCGGPPENLIQNFIAPDQIACLYPALGDEIDYDAADPGNASTGYVGPASAGGKPFFRRFDDGSPVNGDQDLNGDVLGPRNDVMSWLVTYVRYQGDGPTTLRLCFGSDDGGQIFVNEDLVHTNNACRGRGVCQDTVDVEVQPGVLRIAAAAWNRGGGWGLSLALQDALAAPIVDTGDPNADWVFHGATRPAVAFPPCSVVPPVVIRSCERNGAGDVVLSWEHVAPAASIAIVVSTAVDPPATVRKLPGSATSATIPSIDVPQGDPVRVCVDNGAISPACCSISPPPEEVNYWALDGDLIDDIGGNDGIFFGDFEPTFIEGFNGRGGGAVLFDGVDDYVQVTRSIQNEFSISAWVMASMPQINLGGQFWQGSGLIYADVPGGFADFGTSVNGDFFGFGAGPADATVLSTTPVTSGEWMHVAAVRDIDHAAGNSTLRIYVNGLEEGEIQQANTGALTAPASITFGGNTVDSRFYAGALDEIRFFNYPLSDDEVADLANPDVDTGVRYIRGDCNADGGVNIADASFLLNFLFLGGPDLKCLAAGDANDDGGQNIADASFILNFLFLGGRDIGPPNACGQGSAPREDCAAFPPCGGG